MYYYQHPRKRTKIQSILSRLTPKRIAYGVIGAFLMAVCGYLLWTCVITIFSHIFNIGTFIVVAVCLVVIALVIFYPLARKKKPLRIAAQVIAAGIGCFLLYTGAVSALMAQTMLEAPEAAAVPASGKPSKTIVVLGCLTIKGEPSQMLRLRLEKALEYLNADPDAVCIAAGGQGANETEPEAVSMKRWLITKGISENRIYTEERSENTEQNVLYSKEIIDSEALPQRVVIVSECYHIYRAVRRARLLGIADVSGGYPDPSRVRYAMPSYWMREVIALSRDFLLG